MAKNSETVAGSGCGKTPKAVTALHDAVKNASKQGGVKKIVAAMKAIVEKGGPRGS